MFKNLKNLFALSLLFVGHSSFGVNTNGTVKQYTFLLPVNVLRPRNINLQVSLPEGFSPLISPLMAMPGTIFEFRKSGETSPANWSETIVTSVYAGMRVKASDVIARMKSFKPSDQGEIIEELREDRDGYSRHKIIFAYNNPVNGRREVVFMQYFNGPADCSGFQYAVPVDAYESQEAAVQKLREFVHTSIKMLLA